jgi:putative spermidine/putrescine transport system permease protein
LDFLSLVPFAMPAIVLAVGVLQVYSGTPNPLIGILSLGLVPVLSNDPFNIVNTPPLLICAYVIIALPFVYRPIDNSLRAVNTRVLSEAAYSLGSGWWRTFLTVILPNIWPGVISAALLTFSTVMGEFTLATLFNIYTFPIYLNGVGQNDPHKAASLAILSFIFTLVCVLGIILLVRGRPGGRRAGNQVEIAAVK